MSNRINHKSVKFASNFFQRYTIILVWVLLIIVYSALMPNTFATWQNITTMLGSKSVLVVLSLAIMVPLIGGDYDMSVAAVMTFSSMLIAVMNVWWGIPILLAVILAVIISSGVGAVNGLFASILDVNPFVVTMGMQTLLSGIVLLVSRSMTITGLDPALKNAVYATRIAGISIVFYYATIIAIILFYFFSFTAAGRKVLIVGRGRNVAKVSGINVEKVRFLCFVSSGAIAGIAGVLYTGMLGAADPTSGLSYLMPSFAAVFLSTTVITPGLFNSWGCVIAVYFLVTGTTGLSLMGISSAIQNVFYGGALIIAVVTSVMVRRAQSKKELKAILDKEKGKVDSIPKVQNIKNETAAS